MTYDPDKDFVQVTTRVSGGRRRTDWARRLGRNRGSSKVLFSLVDPSGQRLNEVLSVSLGDILREVPAELHAGAMRVQGKCCSRCNSAPWTCRSCRRRYCEHLCGLKKDDFTAHCTRCALEPAST